MFLMQELKYMAVGEQARSRAKEAKEAIELAEMNERNTTPAGAVNYIVACGGGNDVFVSETKIIDG